VSSEIGYDIFGGGIAVLVEVCLCCAFVVVLVALSYASTECCWLQNWSKGKEAVNNTMLFGMPPAELEQG
jgi:hypothetical protein